MPGLLAKVTTIPSAIAALRKVLRRNVVNQASGCTYILFKRTLVTVTSNFVALRSVMSISGAQKQKCQLAAVATQSTLVKGLGIQTISFGTVATIVMGVLGCEAELQRIHNQSAFDKLDQFAAHRDSSESHESDAPYFAVSEKHSREEVSFWVFSAF
ncbi:hypothetical protein ACU8KH_02266 [Lachancea thermotolerans]